MSLSAFQQTQVLKAGNDMCMALLDRYVRRDRTSETWASAARAESMLDVSLGCASGAVCSWF